MISYHVELTKGAKKDLRKLDPSIRAMIVKWLRKNPQQ